MRKAWNKLDFSVFEGKRYSYLTFVKLSYRDGKRANVEVLCDCGNTKIVDWDNLRSGKTKSCGCKQHRERWEGSYHPLMSIWTGIKQRCYNAKSPAYRFYGAKGVEMCEEWRNNYKSFFDWCIENGWKEGMEIDKDIKGNKKLYSPDTCKVVTHAENCAALRGRRRYSDDTVNFVLSSPLSGRRLAKDLKISRGVIDSIRNNTYKP